MSPGEIGSPAPAAAGFGALLLKRENYTSRAAGSKERMAAEPGPCGCESAAARDEDEGAFPSYRWGIRVPLIVRRTGAISAGVARDGPVTSSDSRSLIVDLQLPLVDLRRSRDRMAGC